VIRLPQGTIKVYDPNARSGVILDDTKNEIPFDWDSFRDSRLRELRIGQRVKFELEGQTPSQKVRKLTIVSF
jgi:cold shock CspA family protein